MEDKEQIKVFVHFQHGRTVCICMRNHKHKCNKKCTPEIVERDRFRGWEDLFRQDKYGQCDQKRRY